MLAHPARGDRSDAAARDRPRSILFLDSYTIDEPLGPCSSDAIGWGSTSANAIASGLQRLGYEVTRCPSTAHPTHGSSTPIKHVLDTYQGVAQALQISPPDVIFVFHAFSAFPAELRRIALLLDVSVPMVGYTHGSHWDPTDSVRQDDFPGLQFCDLANLTCLDRVLVVSKHMEETLTSNVSSFNADLGRAIAEKSRVVGLPIDVELIDSLKPPPPAKHGTDVLYNHSPVASKNADVFARVMCRVLAREPEVRVTVTRAFREGDPGHAEMETLRRTHPDRVRLRGDLSKADYYRALWDADVQVSTASHESLGIATLEAMWTDTCCVVPRVGAYPEVCGASSGALYEPGEAQLEERLTGLLQSPQLRRELAASLKERARRYAPDSVVGEIANVLDRCVAAQVEN